MSRPDEMSPQRPDWWQQVSPYLDELLDTPQAARPAWLETLRKRDSTLAMQLEALLIEHGALEQERFLEQGPVPMPATNAIAGRAVGAYKLIDPIGEGGMGSVWLAERSDGRFERRVAIKFLSIALASRGQERFKREGEILGRLTHPNIAELIDAGVTDSGEPFLVLEHVDGRHIDVYCQQRALTVEARVRLVLDVLSAVAYAHANLIVHRDMKPSNVLVREDGQVKLLDFGIAKLLEAQDSPATLLTREGAAPLTPEYAAPEQVTGGPVTTATDVYALGVLLFVLLTGSHPIGPGPHSAADLVKAIVETDPPKLPDAVTSNDATADKLRRQLKGDVSTIVAKALKKDPRERYASVSALADDLNRYLRHEPISARPDTVAYRAAKFVRRNRTAVVLAALAVVAAVAGILGTLMQARTARTQRDFALRQLSRAEAVNDLNSFVLSDAAPSGKPFTVNELLGRAQHIVGRQRAASDPTHVELLVAIGRQYWSQDEDAKARQVLEEAYKLSRALSDRSVRAQASCALASALARAGDPHRPEALFQEGMRELPDESDLGLDRIFCLMRGSEVAREHVASGQAIERAQEALRLLKQSPSRSELQELRIFMDLAESYRVAGRHREASAMFEQASERLTSLGRDDTQTAGTLFNNWALALVLSGRVLESERLFRRAIDISRAGQTEDAVSPMLLNNYAFTLRDLGRLPEAAEYAERAGEKARRAGDELVVNQTLVRRSSIYRLLGDFDRATRMMDEAEPRFQRNLPAGHTLFATINSERGLIAQGRGDLDAGLNFMNQAIAITEKSMQAGRQGVDNLPILLVQRSGIYLQIGRLHEAAADVVRALTMLKQSVEPGMFSSRLGRAYLASGRVLQAQGKIEEARAAFRSATEHLQVTVGADHPDTRAARLAADAPR